MPTKINFAQKRANLKKYGYHCSLDIEINKKGSNSKIGIATRT
jgi:hypothetical protein